MTGKALRPFLTHLDISLKQVADKLGISAQGLDNILKTKDVKSGLLERLARIYNVPITYFYDDKVENPRIELIANGHSAASYNGNATVAEGDAVLQERVKLMETIIAEKDARINDLKDLVEALKKN